MTNFLKNIFRRKSVTLKKTPNKEAHIDNSNKCINELIQVWRKTDLKLNDSASNEIVVETQQKLEYVFPDDFRRFYKQVNGFKDCDVIGDMFSIWPLERIGEEYEKSDDKNFISFCDYLIDSHRIGYLKNQPGVFKDHDRINKIADTFEGTIELIVIDSKLLY